MFEVLSTIFFAILAGFFLWFVLSEGEPFSCLLEIFHKKSRLCEHCEHMRRKFPENYSIKRYTCKIGDKTRYYDVPAEYCRDFEERSTHDPNLDT